MNEETIEQPATQPDLAAKFDKVSADIAAARGIALDEAAAFLRHALFAARKLPTPSPTSATGAHTSTDGG